MLPFAEIVARAPAASLFIKVLKLLIETKLCFEEVKPWKVKMFFPAGLPKPSPSKVIETGLLLIGRFLKSRPVTILRVSSPLSKLICIPVKAFAAALVTKSTVTVLLAAAIPNTVPVRVVLASVTVN